jgi:hypothetical protein
MKRIVIMVSLLFVSGYSHWINKSGMLSGAGPNNESAAQSGYALLSADKETHFVLTSQQTTKWIIRAKQACTLSIYKQSSSVRSFSVAQGSSSFKLLLEPGSYRAVASADAKVKYLEWKVHKIKSIIPLGGGIPATLVVNDKKTRYYRAGKDTVPVFRIKGPTIAYMYARVDVPVDAAMNTLDVSITDKQDKKVISRKTASKRKSAKALYADNTTIVPGKALIITFDVPQGNHEFAVALNGAHGAVKCYAEGQNNKNGTRHRQRTIRW